MTVDWRAVGTGAVAALVFAIPTGVISAIVVDDDTGAALFVFYAVILASMLFGGFVAGSKRPDTPLSHGALAAATAYVVAQSVTLVVKVASGSALSSPVVYVFNLLLAACLGVAGALVADRRNARVQS